MSCRVGELVGVGDTCLLLRYYILRAVIVVLRIIGLCNCV